MSDAPSNAPLKRMFEYNAWANGRIIDACRALGDAQLDLPGAATFGSMRSTLLHVVYAQYSFLARLHGRAQDPRSFSPAWQGLDALMAVATETSDALIVAAAALAEDADIVLEYMGKSYRYPNGFFLTHAVAHGVEHRTQIGMMLAQIGVEAPNLDGWEFAGFAGLGTEV
jgi:uncharacterized damage-inducible protein DinB